MQGYILLHRKIIDHELYRLGPFDKAHAWIDLLLLANYKQRILPINGKEIILKPGQLCWSQKSLAARWRWSVNKLRRYLDGLKKAHMADTENIGITTIITILNWSRYQLADTHADTQTAIQTERKRQTDNNIISNKEINNKKDILNLNNTLSIERYLREFKIVNNKQ